MRKREKNYLEKHTEKERECKRKIMCERENVKGR
jgi:hypothetical protein